MGNCGDISGVHCPHLFAPKFLRISINWESPSEEQVKSVGQFLDWLPALIIKNHSFFIYNMAAICQYIFVYTYI